MGELADALRADGHEDIAAALERKELAGRLRQSGRDDLADALEAGEPTPAAEGTEPSAEPAPHKRRAQQLRDAQSEWITLGGSGGSDGEAA
jgi:hypothetical protein